MECKFTDIDLTELPGGDLVIAGLRDLENQQITEASLLLLVASPRLEGLGIKIVVPPNVSFPYEHALYEKLEQTRPSEAYSFYNSLIRKIVSFARAFEVIRRNR